MNLDESHFDTLDAINIWFGKCQVGAVNVQISDREVRILINDPTQPKETITFNVSTSSIVKTVCHFGDNSTIMFRILKHDLEHIGTKLNLNGPSNIDFGKYFRYGKLVNKQTSINEICCNFQNRMVIIGFVLKQHD